VNFDLKNGKKSELILGLVESNSNKIFKYDIKVILPSAKMLILSNCKFKIQQNKLNYVCTLLGILTQLCFCFALVSKQKSDKLTRNELRF